MDRKLMSRSEGALIRDTIFIDGGALTIMTDSTLSPYPVGE